MGVMEEEFHRRLVDCTARHAEQVLALEQGATDARERLEQERRAHLTSEGRHLARITELEAEIGLSAPLPSELAASSSEPAADGDPLPVHWDGDESTCSICTNDFQSGDKVCRLRCRHMFHSECVDECIRVHVRSAQADFTAMPDCPNCRGAGTIVATWRFISSASIGSTPPPSPPHRLPQFGIDAPE